MVAGVPPESETQAILLHQLVGVRLPEQEAEDFNASKVTRMPEVRFAAEWTRYSEQLRRRTILERVVYRREAARWKDLPTNRMATDDARRAGVSHPEAAIRSSPRAMDTRRCSMNPSRWREGCPRS